MISGSYTGGISFFKGQGAGKYAAGKKLLNKEGKPLSAEYAQTPCLGDWDGDGDWDMVIGFISGPAKLYLNGGKMDFAEAGALQLNGKPLEASDGGPCITDWDGDGKLDLLMGDGEGGVKFYRSKSVGSLELVPGEPLDLIGMLNANEGWQVRNRNPKSASGLDVNRPGVRTKPFAADWNSDGKLDLLVGDYFNIATPAPKLSAQQKVELARLQKEQTKLFGGLEKLYNKLTAQSLKQIGKKSVLNLTPEESRRLSEAVTKLIEKDKTFKAQQQKSAQIYEKIAKLTPAPEMAGYVWVYLRK